jgi:hypothetical protein
MSAGIEIEILRGELGQEKIRDGSVEGLTTWPTSTFTNLIVFGRKSQLEDVATRSFLIN